MNWHSEWAAIAARIEGLISAGHFFIRAMGIVSSDSYNVTEHHLGKEAKEILASLRSFLDAHHAAIPPEAAATLARFLESYGAAIMDEKVKGLDGLKLRVTSLAAVRSSVQYHLSNFESITHKRVERAFLHLQQTIVADDTAKERWNAAFSKGEVACEKLGAAHLMLHGIWAFKVSAEGGRTDLVFGDKLNDAQRISSAADGLVLTEWKIVKDERDSESIANTARDQTRHYAAGILSGIELSHYRYIVLVSPEQLPQLPDIEDGSTIYRHINISVQPLVPSRAALRASAAQPPAKWER